MEKDVCFELWRASDLDGRGVGEILELLRASFPRWPPFDPGVARADHLRWKMESPTAELAAVVGRASNGAAAGSLVASLTIVTQRIQVFGRELPRLRFIDQAVHPEYRGRGISSTLNRFVQETVRQERLRVTDRGQHPAMVRLREHQGSLPLGNPVRAAICPLRPLALARESLAGTWRQRAVGIVMPVLGAASWWRRRSRPSRAIAASSLSVRSPERLDPRFDALWSRAAAEFDVAVVRDRSHLEWRYVDRRGGASTILAAEDGGELVGWAVLKMQGARAYLADLLVVPGGEDAACALADEARARVERAGARAIRLRQHRESRRGFAAGPDRVDDSGSAKSVVTKSSSFIEKSKTGSRHLALG